ncbi:MAG: crossover junction endodeoxyribonuclease RuvC [Caldisericaceae bacterium]
MSDIFVLGIDPGISITGYAVVKKSESLLSLVKFGTIRTKSNLSMPIRLGVLHSELYGIINSVNIDHIAIEKLFFNTNLKTVINVSEARGVILYTANEFNKEVFEYTPLEAKKSIFGQGNASKKEIQAAVMNIFSLDEPPTPDDAADAIAIALCHIYSLPYIGMGV